MPRVVLLSAAVLFLASCALEEQPELALACQMTKCACVPVQASYPLKGEPVPVQWKTNGDAYCPEGYVLRRPE